VTSSDNLSALKLCTLVVQVFEGGLLKVCTGVVQVFDGGLFGGYKVFSLCRKWYCQSGADEDHSVVVYDTVQVGVQLRYFWRIVPSANLGCICNSKCGVRLSYFRVVKLRRFQRKNYHKNYVADGRHDTDGINTSFAVGVRWFVSEVATVLRLA